MSILRERRGKVEIITINRPEIRNAINAEVTSAVDQALDELENDTSCWVVIVTGAGDRAFCSGMDLKAFSAGETGGIVGKGGFAGLTQRDFPKPIIAAVNGHAVAGGFEIMLACDMVVASEAATLGIPETKRGLVAQAGGVIRLAKRLSLATALELAMTGDSITAQRAYELGLVNKVVPPDRVLDEAVALAERVCAASPAAVRASRWLVRNSLDVSEEEAWKLYRDPRGSTGGSPDGQEGARAFIEKRAPQWQEI